MTESSQHDQIRTGNRRGLHGCPDLKLLDFGRCCSALSREIGWVAASLFDTFVADEIGEVRFWQILLQKSFWGGERKLLEPLMRFARGDVRDHIVSSKIDHGSP